MFVDCHCHLNGLSGISGVVREAINANVRLMASNSIDVKSMKENLELQERFPEVKACLGIGPNTASVLSTKELEESLFFLSSNLSSALALGEIGLDFFRAKTEKEKEMQITAFREQLCLASLANKAVCVHSRGAEEECLEMLEDSGAKKVLLHWFSGSQMQIERALDGKYFLSIGPQVIFSKAKAEIAEIVPLSSMLLETDCPVQFNDTSSRPSWIPLVANKVAEIKGIGVGEAEKATERNALSFFQPKRGD